MNKNENKLTPELRFPEFLNDGEWSEDIIENITKAESSSIAYNKLELKKVGYPVYGADSIVGYIDNYQHEDEYISIVKDGSGVGRLNFCESKSTILGTLISLKSKDKKKYNLSWIYYLLNTIDFSSYVKGGGIPHIYYSDYKNEKVFVPKNPTEQQKIASCLSSLDELLTAHTDKLETLKTHKKGLMQNLFPQEGEKVPKLRFKEFENDGEWEMPRLEDKMDIFRGASPRPQGDPKYYGGKVPRLMIEDVTRDGKYSTPKIDSLTEEGAAKSRFLKKGSVVLSCSGTRVAIPGILAVDACIHDGWLGFKNLKEVDTEFLYYHFSNLHEKIQGAALAGGVFNNLTTTILKEMKLGFPRLKEQQKIADTLSSLDTLIAAQADRIEQLKLHKKGLLQGLFPKVKI